VKTQESKPPANPRDLIKLSPSPPHIVHCVGLLLLAHSYCASRGLWTLEWVVRGYVGIHRARKAIQVDGCRPRRMSLRRFPRLFPIRNPCELRGLYRRSYFGPRTCARKECAKLNIVCLSPEQFLCPTIPLSKLAATELPYHEMNPLTCLMSVTSVSTVPVDYQ
jgi:hypothetical protein